MGSLVVKVSGPARKASYTTNTEKKLCTEVAPQPKNLRPQNILSQKNFSQDKSWVKKELGLPKIYGRKDARSKKYFSLKNVGSKKCWVPTKCWLKKKVERFESSESNFIKT